MTTKKAGPKNKPGRKKGTTKQKIKERAAAKQAAEKQAAERPAIEKSDVTTTPWPRAGENKEFEEILSESVPVQTPAQAAKIIKDRADEQAGLKVEDVAEWVKWPFQLWSTSQSLPPIIQPNEAREIAEPLTRIVNRHGVGEKIPPDVIDGMQVVARTLPVVKRGNDLVKSERTKRAKAGQGTEARHGGQAPQGAPQTKPQSV